MHTYPHFTLDYIMYELDMVTANVLLSWAIENDAINRFSGIRMKNGGFSGRESETLFIELKKIIKNIKK